ncbi:fimbrillin family protein [Prevotella communis]|uniref:fimbrillin family protein n=1 Tax=Prevotella communis TaxID=2913614 RepID=UPI001EDBC446|nr:fimbrillin family protein [Prevotella communis]UKK59877.1 fimbrillin family protein [Prevotella communis]
MKNLFYPLLFATALVSAACSNDLENDGNATDPSNKTAILFVGEDNSSATTRYGFADNTLIAMHIRSTNATNASKIRETRTYANALKDATQKTDTYSEIKEPSDDNVRYWDDAFGRNAQLSVFAVAVPGTTTVENNGKTLVNLLAGGAAWSDEKLSEAIDWTVSTDQSGSSTINNEDLTYSNNISKDGEGGAKAYNYTDNDYNTVKAGYLLFRLKDQSENASTDGPGKFDQGNLKFNHALSRVTITLNKGTGYGDGSFKFATSTNVTFLNAPIEGSLNIETGTWTTKTTANITKMYTTETSSSAACTLKAQMLPGYVITDGNDNNVLEFIIDDNKYFITQDMMFDALNGKSGITTNTGSAITMEKGRNYVFNITVGKSKIINVTATLEPWTDVTATDQTMDNSHISLSLFTNDSGSACDNFDLYRLNDASMDISTEASKAKNWGGNYTDKAEKEKKNGKWETKWFFENNKAFYHFRTVNAGTKIKENDSDTDDYFVIESGKQDEAHDYHWGAPFNSSTTSPIVYDPATGYAANLSPAIGATNSIINLIELHMMSNINVVLRTTKDESKDHVALETTTGTTTNQCEVSLTYFYATGKVNMGNGLVSTTGSLSTSEAFTKPTAGINTEDATYNKTGKFTFAVVPQALVRTTGDKDHLYVGITIKTPDNNQYYVVKKLSEIVATANGGSQNQTANSAVTFWYPNHNYTYTFTLTKAGIKDVTCTVEKWVDVTAKNQDITLED